jgi:uncharacterized protein with FMN-binding domain
MKKVLIITVIILAVIMLAIGVFALVLGNGLEATRILKIGGIDPSIVPDGTYEGMYDGGRFTNKVAVTVEDGKITNIEVLKTVTFEKEDVTRQLIGGVIASQSTGIDAVSGATVTTNAYLKAIENALTQK